MSGELPAGWAEARIGDLADLNPKQAFDDETIAGFVPMSHAPTNFRDKLRFDERPWGEIKKAYTNFKDGDVIFAKVTPCFENGKAAFVEGLPNGIGAGSSEFFVLRPSCDQVSAKYLLALVKSHDFLREGAENMTGAVGLRRVPKQFVENYSVLVPPAAEQTRIAAKLDELLAQVDTLKARIDGIPALLKRFRQSVLSAAVSGRLTEEWRAKKLGTEHAAKYLSVEIGFGDFELALEVPESWEAVKLNGACKIISGFAFSSGSFVAAGIPVVKISNVQCGGFEEKNQEYLPLELMAVYEKFIVRSSDLLMALTRPVINNTLKVCKYPKDAPPALLNQRVCRFEFNEPASKDFFEFLFQAEYFKKQVISNLSETLQPNLSPKDLALFTIGLPPLQEQTEIVRRVEQLFAFADQLEAKVNEARTRIDRLTQSILAKAFRGELVPQDPADEPASVLLERIQAQRVSAPKTRRGRKSA
ncbi:MAG: restriction endonuclease subunit S [Pseudomonas sp.]|nr:restriction endonuclease subunit S [Pseudomonas sp.]